MELKSKENSHRFFLINLTETNDPVCSPINGYINELINGNMLVYCGVTGKFNQNLYDLAKSNDLIIDTYKKTTTFWNDTNEMSEYYYEVKPEILDFINKYEKSPLIS